MGRMTTKEFRKLYITYKCKSHTIVMSYFEKKYNDIVEWIYVRKS